MKKIEKIIVLVLIGVLISLTGCTTESDNNVNAEETIEENLVITGKIIDYQTNGAGHYKIQMIWLEFDTGDIVGVNSGISHFRKNVNCTATFSSHIIGKFGAGDMDYRNLISIEYLD